MKLFCIALLFMLTACAASSKEIIYLGSTPADITVRKFLGISLTDSIDFIKWLLVMDDNSYELNCRYGIGKPNTNGFTDEKQVAFKGEFTKQGSYYALQRGNKTLNILEINPNVLHLLDGNKQFLIGNGGYSFALNNKSPQKSTAFNYTSKQNRPPHVMAFQGRTPCIEKVAGCIKKKWFVQFFTDAPGAPAYYLQGGRQNEERGQWEVIQKNNRIIYKLTSTKYPKPIYLLKSDDNILFFTDEEGNLLVGNEDFSYTLNRADPK